MTWRVVAAKAIGTAHQANGSACQDAYCVEQDDKTLLIFVADGAGSVAYGGEGAKLAVQTAVTWMQARLVETPLVDTGFPETWPGDCLVAVRDRLQEQATAAGHALRDYACTLLGVVISGGQCLIMQLGDGAIVLDNGEGWQLPIAPMIGEYANMTVFVSDVAAAARLVSLQLPVPRALAVFSDGLQGLALDLKKNCVHAPFFTPFFDVLAKVNDEQLADLPQALQKFLDSPAVTARTDDDKTLVLAYWSDNKTLSPAP